MHRYQPRLHIVESSDVQSLNWEDFSTFEFPKTQFITVTAYQNDKVCSFSPRHTDDESVFLACDNRSLNLKLKAILLQKAFVHRCHEFG